jgi:hypothetical protein
MRNRSLLIFFSALLLSAAAPATTAQNRCTEDQQKQVLHDLAKNQLKNWSRVYRSFQDFAQCDGSSVAEGYSAAIAHLLTSDWQQLDVLIRLTTSDKPFKDFVLRHIDNTLSEAEVKAIGDNAEMRCVEGEQPFCRNIVARVQTYNEKHNALRRSLEGSNKPLGPEPVIQFPSAQMAPPAKEQFLSGDFTIVTDMNALPNPVRWAFTEIGGYRLLIANPVQHYQSSDNVTDTSMPRARLIFAGVAKNKSFVYFQPAGWIQEYLVEFFKIASPHTANPVWRGSCQKASSSLLELRTQVADGGCQSE